jgi:hypothetical protein
MSESFKESSKRKGNGIWKTYKVTPKIIIRKQNFLEV